MSCCCCCCLMSGEGREKGPEGTEAPEGVLKPSIPPLCLFELITRVAAKGEGGTVSILEGVSGGNFGFEFKSESGWDARPSFEGGIWACLLPGVIRVKAAAAGKEVARRGRPGD